jgi:hypothetical protein
LLPQTFDFYDYGGHMIVTLQVHFQ